jgi:hypothetical protein
MQYLALRLSAVLLFQCDVFVWTDSDDALIGKNVRSKPKRLHLMHNVGVSEYLYSVGVSKHLQWCKQSSTQCRCKQAFTQCRCKQTFAYV